GARRLDFQTGVDYVQRLAEMLGREVAILGLWRVDGLEEPPGRPREVPVQRRGQEAATWPSPSAPGRGAPWRTGAGPPGQAREADTWFRSDETPTGRGRRAATGAGGSWDQGTSLVNGGARAGPRFSSSHSWRRVDGPATSCRASRRGHRRGRWPPARPRPCPTPLYRTARAAGRGRSCAGLPRPRTSCGACPGLPAC